ncbi:hypothetical protein OJAV_G00038380 [Oryzias javanicus]|uniref:Uncharacterized protein n=1 Tax=Oryzias javanicus TaxID=123683 RepID=A0A3S2PZF1_ORYJA|nr:hypothetical protein OJAV_G00038380 [Oryzias javanicus]
MINLDKKTSSAHVVGGIMCVSQGEAASQDSGAVPNPVQVSSGGLRWADSQTGFTLWERCVVAGIGVGSGTGSGVDEKQTA